MSTVHDVMIRKLKAHSALSRDDIAVLQSQPATTRNVAANEDLVRQGENPKVSIIVLSGMLGRYHTLRSGGRQYLSFHIAGDWPDAQALFVERMDHSVCAMNEASIATISHRRLIGLIERVPSIAFAIWRETLIDAAIFRQAITNNGKREITVRLAHFLCEQFYRAKAADLVTGGACDLPLSQTQIADALGSSLTTINRAMQSLRKTRALDLTAGRLQIRNWPKLADYGDFDPAYLHLRRAPHID